MPTFFLGGGGDRGRGGWTGLCAVVTDLTNLTSKLAKGHRAHFSVSNSADPYTPSPPRGRRQSRIFLSDL